MIKINRPNTPNIAIYKDKKFKLAEDVRLGLLTLIDATSTTFKSYLPRLQNKEEEYTKAERETLRAIHYYGDPNNFANDKKQTTAKGPNFTVYKDDELKEELKTLFKKKCAYCESSFLATSNADIEHFRPKKAFNPFRDNQDEALKEPGYYWLASDWHNLLWSCALCNRRNNLDEPNDPREKPLGKKNRFPLSDESKRIRSHNGDLQQETALLLILDPCIDDPAEHLEFPTNNNDDLGIVRPKKKGQGQPSPKGTASIPLYGLNRAELVLARTEEALELKGTFLALLDSIDAYAKKKNAQEDTAHEAAAFKLQKKLFKAKLAETAPYLGIKRTLLKEFEDFPKMRSLKLTINKLLA